MTGFRRVGKCLLPALVLAAAVAGCPPSQPPTKPAGATSDPTAAASASELDRPALECPAGMVAIVGGTLEAEVPGDWNVAKIQVQRFCLDTTEVSAIAFARCVADGACSEGHVGPDYDGILRASLRQPDMTQLPMNYVTVERARAFCGWAGKLLPKWYELVWAAQNADQKTKYPWGNDPPATQHVCSPSCSTSASVGAPDASGENWPKGLCTPACPIGKASAGASTHGVYDLMGNVYDLVDFVGESRQQWAFGNVPASGGGFFGLTSQAAYVGFRCAHVSNGVRANVNADGPLPLPPAPTKLAAKPAPPPDEVQEEEEGCSAEKTCQQLAPDQKGLRCATPDIITSCGAPGCVEMQRACGGNGECPEGYRCDAAKQISPPTKTTLGQYSPRQCVVESCKSSAACKSRNLICSGGRCVHRRCSRSKQCAGYCVTGRCWSEAGFCHNPNLKRP